MKRGKITERTLYPSIKNVLKECGAGSVTEVTFDTTPDLVAKWLGEEWLISVKIGDPTRKKLLKEAFIQYMRHKEDSNAKYGMIVFYPEDVRKIEPRDEVVEDAVRTREAYFIVEKPQFECRKPLPDALREIERVLKEKIPTRYSLSTVVSMLRAQVEDLMSRIDLSDEQLFKFISKPELFLGLSPVEEKTEEKRKEALLRTSKFLAAYIFLSQVFFLRLYHESRPTFIDIDIENLTREGVRDLFEKIKEINYRPIFGVDVLDFTDEELIRETFWLLFGLQVKDIRYELPGRLFHTLMPKNVRKLLAAFYTRPVAAHILARLTIDSPNVSVFDPACGSGTILTMAYRRVAELWKKEGSPHKQLCEKQIYGCDIMPFAVHLTNANLVAMEPLETITHTQIVLGDSLKLVPEKSIEPGFVTLARWMPSEDSHAGEVIAEADVFDRQGNLVKIKLKPVDVILMNPPFTKVERGIKKYIDVSRFEKKVGSEVGVWGHFVALADKFLKSNGVLGAVLPINLLRGRESEKVREMIFCEYLPLYVIKASMNYGFSEYAEYRDVLVIARKTRQRAKDHKVKFCIIKKNLNELKEDEIERITEQIKTFDVLRSDLLDVDSHPLDDVLKHFDNMMLFISGPSLEGKDALRRVIGEAEKLFCPFPHDYFKEGYGPRPKGVSGFMFVTRPMREGRKKEAFLELLEDRKDKIVAKTPAGVQRFEFDKSHFLPSLRTPTGIDRMDVTGTYDYVAKEPYEGMDKVMELCGFKEKLQDDYWDNYVRKEFKRAESRVAVVCRIGPYSPDHMLLACYSDTPLVLANLFHAVRESDSKHAKALVTLFNSIFFLAYLFDTKEETTGRWIHLRHQDLYRMRLYPKTHEQIERLVDVYEKFKSTKFPALREQLDRHFDDRYEWFWDRKRKKGKKQSPPGIEPHELRLEFDRNVVKAVGADLSDEDILNAYRAIVWDMIVTRGLKKD